MLTNEDAQVLTDLKSILDHNNISMLVVGAGARLIIFDQRYNIQGRSTKDWDIAISMQNWSNYNQLIALLTQGNNPYFKITNNEHTLIHIKTNITIDLIPFGEIGKPDQQIKWNASETIMNIAGFDEALLHSSTEIINDLEFKIVNIPALIALKLFAWEDRGTTTKKDLGDIDFILKHYSDPDRIYENQELMLKIAEGDIDFLDASIYLLGQDMSQILKKETLKQIKTILAKIINQPGEEIYQDSLEYRLQMLQKGILDLS